MCAVQREEVPWFPPLNSGADDVGDSQFVLLLIDEADDHPVVIDEPLHLDREAGVHVVQIQREACHPSYLRQDRPFLRLALHGLVQLSVFHCTGNLAGDPLNEIQVLVCVGMLGRRPKAHHAYRLAVKYQRHGEKRPGPGAITGQATRVLLGYIFLIVVQVNDEIHGIEVPIVEFPSR